MALGNLVKWFAIALAAMAVCSPSVRVSADGSHYTTWNKRPSSGNYEEPNIAGKWIADNSTEQKQFLFDFQPTASYEFDVTVAGSPLDWATGRGYIDSTGEVKVEADSGEVLYGNLDLNSLSITWNSTPPRVPYARWVKIPDANKVHVVFMNHLDVGYNGISPQTGYINNVMNRYFGTYFPRAAELGRIVDMSALNDSFVYTTHPWLLSFYFDCPPGMVLSGVELKCPSEEEKEAVTKAIRTGVITWHAGAMNMQYELMDVNLLLASLYIAESLSDRFNVSYSCSVSLRDVPGLPSSMLDVVESYFSKLCSRQPLISVGVNPGSSPPSPSSNLFDWSRNGPGSGHSLATWHAGGYPSNPGFDAAVPGGLSYKDIVVIPEAKMALAFAFRTDNTGPPKSLAEIHDNFETVRGLFPTASVVASSFDQFSSELQANWKPTSHSQLDVGDTWIQGVASDPRKMAEFRALRAAYTECITRGVCKMNDPVLANATRYMIKLAEHTWGLPSVGDIVNWANKEFDRVKNQSNFQACINSWKEQREFKTLFLKVVDETSLLGELCQYYLSLLVPPPQDSVSYDYEKIDVHQQIVLCPGTECTNPLTVLFDYNTGGIADLHSKNTTWADSSHVFPMVTYHTYNETDFSNFASSYDYHGNAGYDKPNSTPSAHPLSNTWLPSKVEFYKGKWVADNYLAVLSFDSKLTTEYGAPTEIWINYTFTSLVYTIDLDVIWFNKRPTRLAEATMLRFTPVDKQGDMKCSFSQFGQDMPVLNSMVNGSVYQRAGDGFVCNFTGASCPAQIKVTSRDVPILCPVFKSEEPTPFPYPFQKSKEYIQTGMGFNLHNNIWNTNYPLWYPFTEGEGDENFASHYELTLGSQCG
jgi:hypothetical protein